MISLMTILPINPGQVAPAIPPPNYFHINSVDKDPEGNYLISARDACAVHKINATTGEIIWHLVGVKSDVEQDQRQVLLQRHTGFVSQDGSKVIISLYDNSAHGTEENRGRQVHAQPFSQGKKIEANTATFEAKIVEAFQSPESPL